MMAWTDRHCRYLHRLAAPHALLFTEMIATGALLNGPAERLLAFDPAEHPVAIQLGGSEPDALARVARLAADAGFNEINLNVGCPSPRVRQGGFGAGLMREPELVRDCLAAMAGAVQVPVTVKCRLGVDDYDSETFLHRFVTIVAESGCRTLYVHARKALLQGLSPAENRTVPPLEYSRAYGLKRAFPELEVVVNGGIRSVAELDAHLARVDGVMVGRAAYQQPEVLGEMDAHLFGESRSEERSHDGVSVGAGGSFGTAKAIAPQSPAFSRDADCSGDAAAERSYVMMARYREYMHREVANGTRLADMTRHALGLFAGRPGARRFRRVLSDATRLKDNDLGIVDDALAALGRRAGQRAA